MYVFVNGASFIVGQMVAMAKDALDKFRFFFTWAMYSVMIACAFDTPGAVKTVDLGIDIDLLHPYCYICNIGLVQIK